MTSFVLFPATILNKNISKLVTVSNSLVLLKGHDLPFLRVFSRKKLLLTLIGIINLEFFMELILEFVMSQFLSFNVSFLKSAE